MKHNQLTAGLRQIGLQTELHNLEIMDIVARLMGIPKEQVSNEWSGIYCNYMEKATDFPITELGEELLQPAKECYHLLLACMEIEKTLDDLPNS